MKHFQAVQKQFTAHIKNPNVHSFDYGIEDRRLKIYRDLFFNNIISFLNSAFPVLKSLYTDQHWQILARKFFAEHKCKSPFFIDISKAFVEYLSNEYRVIDSDPVFMRALAHYEWLELDVSTRQAQVIDSSQLEVLGGSQITFSEAASLVSYNFPVHQISPEFQPTVACSPIYLVVYRNPHNIVEFTLVNEVTALLLNLVEKEPAQRASDLVSALCPILPQMPESQLANATFEILDQFNQKTIVNIE